jgi:hypothetical protein
MDSQAELFPFANPETVLAHCRRLEARVLAIAPELSKQDCTAMLAELALADLMLDSIDRRIRQTPEYHARVVELPLPVKLFAIDGNADVPTRWRWRRRRNTHSSWPR